MGLLEPNCGLNAYKFQIFNFYLMVLWRKCFNFPKLI